MRRMKHKIQVEFFPCQKQLTYYFAQKPKTKVFVLLFLRNICQIFYCPSTYLFLLITGEKLYIGMEHNIGGLNVPFPAFSTV